MHIFTAIYSPLHGFIWNQHSDQFSVGLLAQLLEHCTSITEVMGSNPIQAYIFFRPSFHYCLSSVHYCKERCHIHMMNFYHQKLSLLMKKKKEKDNLLNITQHWFHWPHKLSLKPSYKPLQDHKQHKSKVVDILWFLSIITLELL